MARFEGMGREGEKMSSQGGGGGHVKNKEDLDNLKLIDAISSCKQGTLLF